MDKGDEEKSNNQKDWTHYTTKRYYVSILDRIVTFTVILNLLLSFFLETFFSDDIFDTYFIALILSSGFVIIFYEMQIYKTSILGRLIIIQALIFWIYLIFMITLGFSLIILYFQGLDHWSLLPFNNINFLLIYLLTFFFLIIVVPVVLSGLTLFKINKLIFELLKKGEINKTNSDLTSDDLSTLFLLDLARSKVSLFVFFSSFSGFFIFFRTTILDLVNIFDETVTETQFRSLWAFIVIMWSFTWLKYSNIKRIVQKLILWIKKDTSGKSLKNLYENIGSINSKTVKHFLKDIYQSVSYTLSFRWFYKFKDLNYSILGNRYLILSILYIFFLFMEISD